MNGNGRVVAGNGDSRENGGQRSRQNSGGKLNGSGSDDQINEHFYDVPEVTFVICTFPLRSITNSLSCSGRGLHGDLRDDRQKESGGEGDEEQEREHGGARDPDPLCQIVSDVVNKASRMINDQP